MRRLLGRRMGLGKLVVAGIAISSFALGIDPAIAADGSLELEIEKELAKMAMPELPPLGDASLYLHGPEEIFDTTLVLRLQKRQVEVYQQDRLIASYPVAVGKKGWETPQGSFQVIQMIENPSWKNPWSGKVIPAGPNNPLGERWIGFWTDGKNFIGFHGTPGEHLIGQAVSHGCVRMKNKDIRALFELISLGSPVVVKP